MGQSWYQLEWVWRAAGWAFAIGGAALVLWSLMRDRARGRRRCPQCWYDMSGAVPKEGGEQPRFICPECGRSSVGVQSLLRTRRRWTRAVFGALLLGAAWATYGFGGSSHGWVSAVPTTLLILVAPTSPDAPAMSYQTRGFPYTAWNRVSAPERLSDEAWWRLLNARNWTWQSEFFVGRAIRSDGWTFDAAIEVPRYVVTGERLAASIARGRRQVFHGLGVVFSDGRASESSGFLVSASVGPMDVVFPAALFDGSHELHRTQVHKTIEVFDRVDALMQAWDGPDTTRVVSRVLEPRIIIKPGNQVLLGLNAYPPETCPLPKDTYLGCAARIHRGTELLGTTEFVLRRTGNRLPNVATPLVKWENGAEASIAHDPAGITVTLRGQPELAWAAYSDYRLAANRPWYWSGSTDVVPVVNDLRAP